MQAVVLAAGQGKRLRPLTENIPKPLVEVLGKPLLEYALDVLVPHVDEFIVVTGYKEKKIKEHLGTAYQGVPVTYVEQEERLGTGNALFLCKQHIHGTFVMIHADEIFDTESVQELLTHKAAAMASKREDPENFGVVVYDKNMNLRYVEEKPAVPKTNLVSAGAFTLTPEIFNHYPPPEKNGEYYLAEMIPSYLHVQPMKVVEAKLWLTINKPEDIPAAETVLKQSVPV